jgi:hypothetical protein
VREFLLNYDVRENSEKWQLYLKFIHAQAEELMTGFGCLDHQNQQG